MSESEAEKTTTEGSTTSASSAAIGTATATATAAASPLRFENEEPGAYGIVPSSLCLVRIKRDLKRALKEGPELGLYLYADENDVLSMHALIVGPPDTPYDGGLFLFFMRCPPVKGECESWLNGGGALGCGALALVKTA
eukprot:m.283634 g.283634  ORF g.283634 m.283634 type:complete len:139 (-) comp19418_c0_seq18:116-532(-)